MPNIESWSSWIFKGIIVVIPDKWLIEDCIIFLNCLQVTPDVHFQKDLGLDSLDNVEIVMALEEEFKLEIPDKEADKIDSCNLAIEYIYNHPMAG